MRTMKFVLAVSVAIFSILSGLFWLYRALTEPDGAAALVFIGASALLAVESICRMRGTKEEEDRR